MTARSTHQAVDWFRATDWAMILVLLGAVLSLYWRVTLAGRIFTTEDAFSYFYPNLAYAAERLRHGELPLWNPYLFAGAPFLANSQTGVFYLPNLVFLFLPVARAYAWSIVSHVFLAGVGTYLFSRRSLSLTREAALVAGLIFALGGFGSAQVGHLNQLQTASWLPLMLTGLDEVRRRKTVRTAILVSPVFALQVLSGHTQNVYLSIWAIFVYFASRSVLDLRVGTSGHRRPATTLRTEMRLGALIALALISGFCLAAVQMLPTLELTQESIRAGGLGYRDAVAFSLPPWEVLRALLPTFGEPSILGEWLGYIGMSGLILAALVLAVRPDRRVIPFVFLALLALFFAFGQFNPAYPLVHEVIPGFDMFRVPARWLFIYSFAAAALAAMGLDALIRVGRSNVGVIESAAPSIRSDESIAGPPSQDSPRSPPSPTPQAAVPVAEEEERSSLSQGIRFALVLKRLGILTFIAVLATGFGFLKSRGVGFDPELPGLTTVLAWGLFIVASLGLARAAIGISQSRAPRARYVAAAFVVLVAVELVLAGQQLELNETVPSAIEGKTRAPLAYFVANPGIYRILPITDTAFELEDRRELEATLSTRLTSDEVLDTLQKTKSIEMLLPNLPLRYRIASLDGYDGGVLPLRRYVELKGLFPVEGLNLPDGRLRLQLKSLPDPHLVGWLNVKYVMLDRQQDYRAEGIEYDLAAERTIAVGEPLVLDGLPQIEAQMVSLMLQADGSGCTIDANFGIQSNGPHALPTVGNAHHQNAEESGSNGCPDLAIVTLIGADGSSQAYPVEQEASDVADGVRVITLVLENPTLLRQVIIEVSRDLEPLNLRGLTLIDAAAGSSHPASLSPYYELVHFGTAKIYRNRAVLPRAFVVGEVHLVDGPEEALLSLASPEFDAARQAVVENSEWARTDGGVLQGSSAAVEVLEYQPERIVLEATLEEPGLLVLTDAHYPGWLARVDGQEEPVIRVNHLFRGVRLEAGSHRIEFEFRPRSLNIGAVISGLAVLAVALVGIRPLGLLRRQ